MEDYTEDKEVHLGKNIKDIRRILGVSQIDLADKLRMDPTQLNRLERYADIDEEILERIAKELNVTPDFIRRYDNDAMLKSFFNSPYSSPAVSDVEGNVEAEAVANDESNNKNAVNVNGENAQYVVNPLDKVTELYERLLAELKEKNEALQKEIDELKRKNS